MKIAIDGRTILQKQRGMPVYCDNLIWYLANARLEDEFFVFINSGFEHNELSSEYAQRLMRIRALSNVQIIDLPSDGFMYWEQWLLPKALKKLSIDLLHMPANRICLTTNTPQIATIHDAMEWKNHTFPAWTFRGLRGWIYSVRKYLYVYFQYTLGLKKLQHIVTISQYAQDDIIASFPATVNKISFVYHGLPEIFAQLTTPLPLAKRKHVLMLGGESPHKNPKNMLKAFAALPFTLQQQHPLVIIGINPANLATFTAWVAEFGIVEHCELLTWVDEAVLVEHFVHAHALLFASVEEGFGFPLIQAMAAGTPTVLSNATVLLELSQGVGEHAAYDDIAGLSNALSILLSQPEYWEKKSQRMIQHAQAFTWDSSINKLCSIYNNKVLKHV